MPAGFSLFEVGVNARPLVLCTEPLPLYDRTRRVSFSVDRPLFVAGNIGDKGESAAFGDGKTRKGLRKKGRRGRVKRQFNGML